MNRYSSEFSDDILFVVSVMSVAVPCHCTIVCWLFLSLSQIYYNICGSRSRNSGEQNDDFGLGARIDARKNVRTDARKKVRKDARKNVRIVNR